VIARPRTSSRTVLALAIALSILASCGGDPGGESADGPRSGVPGPTVTVAVPSALESLPTVELTEPGSSAVGETPRFGWRPVEGAAEYRLVVTDATGPVWAWQGPETTVRFGGVDDPQPGYIGIRLLDPGWWSVAALDGDGRVMAVSVRRSVSPDERTPGDPASGDRPAAPSPEEDGPIDPTTVDPCTVLDLDEVAAALGASVHPGELSTGAGGAYRSCTWVSTVDERDEVQLAINNDPASYNPSGWTRGEIVTVDGLGDDSFLVTDFGVRVGFLRSGVAVTVVALVHRDTAPTWVELARTVDVRLVDGHAAG
jgi:hypothetical protein